MSKTIEQLTQANSPDDLYVLGTKNNESVSYNLGSLNNSINSVYQSIGEEVIEAYDNTKNYYIGQYIKYNSKIYRVLDTIFPGQSLVVGTNIIEITVLGEIKNLNGWGGYETIEVEVYAIDESGNKITTGIQWPGVINITSGTTTLGQILYDTTGKGSVNNLVTHGTTYNASAPEISGYYTPGTYYSLKANLQKRKLYFIYRKINTSVCNLSIEVDVLRGGVTSDFTGQTLMIEKTGTTEFGTTGNGVVNSDGKVVFTPNNFNIYQGTSYTIKSLGETWGGITNTYINPGDTIITPNASSQVVKISYVGVKKPYGLFAVKDDGTEEYIDQDFIDTLGSEDKETYKAIHVNTETLAKNGYDYYVRCKDLTSERTITTKTWQTNYGGWKSLPNVSTNTTTEYRGQLMTYYMSKNSRTYQESSPAADYARTQTLTINNKTAYGYIGTKAQLDFILPASYSANKTLIYNFLTAIGYATPNYSSTYLWSSSQYYAVYAWFWDSGGYWNYGGYKNGAYLVVPLFSFSSL